MLASSDADVARTADDVVQAWSLLHDTYTDAGYIGGNASRIHTAREAIINPSVVLVRRREGAVVSTVTCINDGPAGLPLDSVYSEELATLRSHGHRLVEVGLFADRRDASASPSPAVLGLLRLVYWWGVYTRATDLVIGVHPRRASFYHSALGFYPWSEPTVHPRVRNWPVQLLHANLRHIGIEAPHRYSCMPAIVGCPVGADLFDERIDPREPWIDATTIGEYLGGRIRAA